MDIWVDEIEGWDQRPFAGGYAALHDLADSSFSGAVSSGAAWLLFVNGRVVAVGQYRQGPGGASFEDADIERFEDAEGTVYEAPHPSVPLLVAMQLADGETRGRYYTEQTPIEEVDGTLTSGGFTGYLELSENVLSGDYYTVYQAGRSMDLGFVGNSRRLETEDEARETARDEVGIYEVVAVDLDVTPIPDAGDSTTAAAGTGAAAVGGDGADDGPEETEPTSDPTPDDAEPTAEPTSRRSRPEWASGDLTAAPGRGAATDAPEERSEPDTVSDEDSEDDEPVEPEPMADPERDEPTDATPDADPEPDAPVEAATTRVDDAEPAAEAGNGEPAGAVASATTDDDLPADEELVGRDAAEPDPGTAVSNAPASPPSTGGNGDGVAASATEQLASRSVPSLDPARSDDGSGTVATGDRRDRPSEREATARAADNGAAAATGGSDTADEPSVDASDEDVAALREELSAAETALEDAETERDEARDRVAELESTLERVETERDELREEVERLRDRVAELESQVGGTGAGPSLSAAEALAGTNLFVRYRSKGKTTVEDVHGGAGTPEDLDANLKVTSHTQFEAEGATVEGEPFAEWLAATQQHRFATWLVSRFVFEVRDTGSAERMPDVYDALPAIDRIEFDGSVTVPDGDGEREVGFDVVCRDRMGDPLVVANLDASREPVGEAGMATLVQDAVGVCRAEGSLAAAFSVTAAFFESAALETAADATDSSLLSRDSRLSYVKESRRRGFHLALVESRDGDFHLAVPDL